MNPPPPCVSKTNPLYTRWQFQNWQKNNRHRINQYNRNYYWANLLKERERHRLYKQGYSNKGTKPLPPNKIVDKLEADRIYRNEMAAKGIYL